MSTYVHGSLALGGFHPRRSDIDVLVIVGDRPPLAAAELKALGGRLVALPLVGRGVELSIVTRDAAQRPSAPWPFLLHVTTAPDDFKIVVGVDHGGDRDLLMHYVVTRSAGIVVRGDPPAETIGPIPRDEILRYLADELRRAESNAGETYGVLNAARARCFLADGRIVSKIDGGRAALASEGPNEVLARALRVQEGHADDRPLTADATRYVRAVRDQLTAAYTTRRDSLPGGVLERRG
ncbi:MAG: DUF4111 domain-containing protein [Ilumatobacteraceae bacterium]